MKKNENGLDRRTFIKLTGMAASTVILPSCFSSNDKKVRFGLVTDSHYAERDPYKVKHYREALGKMTEFVNVMNEQQVDFVMHMGDFKDEDENKREEDTLGYLRKLESEYGKFNGPRYHCVGNHDVDSITKEQFQNNIENTGIPKDRSYYSYDFNDFHFVVLDANYDKDGKDHFFKEGSDWQDTNIPNEQLEWLQQDLASTKLDCIVFCHHPLFEYWRDDFKFHVNDYEKTQRILEESGKVKIVFQGHNHREIFKEINGIHYCTHHALVDHSGPENNSYSIVTLENDQIKIDGYRRSSSWSNVQSKA